MLALFYIFIGIAIGVSFWQITRILNLRGVIATDEDNAKQGKYSLVFMAFLYAMMVYCLIFRSGIRHHSWWYIPVPFCCKSEGNRGTSGDHFSQQLQ